MGHVEGDFRHSQRVLRGGFVTVHTWLATPCCVGAALCFGPFRRPLPVASCPSLRCMQRRHAGVDSHHFVFYAAMRL
jgi:hypothetical protein